MRKFASPSIAAALALLSACGETTIDIQDQRPSPDVEVELGLRLHLSLDELEAGAIAVDTSGYAHDGAPSSSPPTPSTSVPPVGFDDARSLAFDGLTQYLDLGNPSDLNLSGTLSISAWVRAHAVDGFRDVVAHGWHQGPAQEVALRINDGAYEFLTWDGVDHLVSTPMPDGDIDSWHHVCGVYDGASYLLYRDGRLLAERPATLAPIAVDETWGVGARGSAGPSDGRYFSGMIDEVRVYARALTPAEVQALASE